MDPLTKPRARRPRVGVSIMVGSLAAALALVFALWFFQERLIYPAAHYAERDLVGLPSSLVLLRDPANSASVLGFYRATPGEGAPRKLWLLFSGNGDAALRWDPIVAPSVAPGVGFLMVEYPGYGARAGKPSPASLLNGTEQTLQALAHHLGTTIEDLQARTALVGYSLGSAAALQYAARYPVQRIVLLAPFTSMLEMARRSVGSPLCYLLSHRYDNVAALQTIAQHGLPPLTILHGEHDSFIPRAMGEALAAQAPGSHFELVPRADHADVIDIAAPRLQQLFAEP